MSAFQKLRQKVSMVQDKKASESAATDLAYSTNSEPAGALMEIADDIRRFIFAPGTDPKHPRAKAVFTLVGKTGRHFTYRVRRAEGENDSRPWFVDVLVGPDNTKNFMYVGTVFPDTKRYFHGKKAKMGPDAPSVQMIRWLFDQLNGGTKLGQIQFWHEAHCSRCGRRLTHPKSCAIGMGPKCAGAMA